MLSSLFSTTKAVFYYEKILKKRIKPAKSRLEGLLSSRLKGQCDLIHNTQDALEHKHKYVILENDTIINSLFSLRFFFSFFQFFSLRGTLARTDWNEKYCQQISIKE